MMRTASAGTRLRLVHGTKRDAQKYLNSILRSQDLGQYVEHGRTQAEAALKLGPAYNRELDLVFANEVGEPLDRRNLVQQHFKKIVKEAGLPVSLRLYDLRHTCCTLLLATGVNVKVVDERLGHASAAMTLNVYGHVLPGRQEEATRKLERALFE